VKRGPLVEEDMFVLPVVAAGDCHIVWMAGGSEYAVDCISMVAVVIWRKRLIVWVFGEALKLSSKIGPCWP